VRYGSDEGRRCAAARRSCGGRWRSGSRPTSTPGSASSTRSRGGAVVAVEHDCTNCSPLSATLSRRRTLDPCERRASAVAARPRSMHTTHSGGGGASSIRVHDAWRRTLDSCGGEASVMACARHTSGSRLQFCTSSSNRWCTA
jgi:hypothetical protein